MLYFFTKIILFLDYRIKLHIFYLKNQKNEIPRRSKFYQWQVKVFFSRKHYLLDGSLLSSVTMSNQADLDAAVVAAKAALIGWSKTTIKERVQV